MVFYSVKEDHIIIRRVLNSARKKILVTAGFHLAKKLLDQGHTVIGLDVNLKYGRLNESNLEDNKSSTYPNHKFIKANLEDAETLNKLFDAAQAGVRYSIENPHAYISSNILEACRKFICIWIK